jgi:DNA modification methylase
MAKDVASLVDSRKAREEIIRKFGGDDVLKSIWKTTYTNQKNIIDIDKTQNAVAKERHSKMDYDKSLYKVFAASSKSVRGESGGLSIFPADICRRLVLLFSDEGDTVLDPCAGHNSRMQMTWNCNRNYIGYDVSKEFMEFNRGVRDILLGDGDQGKLLIESPATITLHEQSSEKMNEPDNSVDFVLTSPPYWDIEFYGKEEEQLGFGKTYEEFLAGLGRVISESFRVLKPGKFAVYNINDFRKNGKYYCYHSDLAKLAIDAGYVYHDIIILEWPASLGACFATQVINRKSTAKSHEYLMVFKKPE